MLYSPEPMHIPDGFLSVPVAVLLWIVSAIAISYALRRASAELDERKVPLMGVLAAAIFAGQMLNFTVLGGTSGHLMGAAIATILLGPWAAVLVMTTVVSVQALIFQDGGLLALGANIFNMGVIGVAVSYAVYRTMQNAGAPADAGVFSSGGFLAAWLSIEIAALACALELAVSGTSPANIAIPAMGGIHALIGIGEALITVGVLAFVYAARPDLLAGGEAKTGKSSLVWVIGLVIALALAVLPRWPPLTRMAWSGSPSGKASWRWRAGLFTRSSRITPSREYPTRRWRPSWLGSSAHCSFLALRCSSRARAANSAPPDGLMHAHFLDPYRPRASLVHQLDPRVKLVLTLAFIFTVALTPPGAWPVYILLLAVIISVELLSDLGVGYVMKRVCTGIPLRAGGAADHFHRLRSNVGSSPSRQLDSVDLHTGFGTVYQHRHQILDIRPGCDRPGGLHILPGFTRSHASHPHTAPAGRNFQLDVALPVCAGG